MTKYILVGGYHWKAEDGGKAFAAEMVKGFPEPVKLLICSFARPHKVWRQLLNEDRTFFSKHLPNIKLDIQLAEPNNFTEQVKWANSIFLRGGDNSKLKKSLNKAPAWQKHLQGKTLAGSSAGANVIAKYYYSPDELRLGKGFDMLPVKVLVHYKSDYNSPNVSWSKSYRELKNYKEALRLVTLKEGQFKIINR